MKKIGILNSDINRVLGYMRHKDTICISDCGLPVAQGVELIDISLKLGFPTFFDVFSEIFENMKIEEIILAIEIMENNKKLLADIESKTRSIKTDFVSHKDFKELTKNCKAVIRTGEATPYANIILKSACIF